MTLAKEAKHFHDLLMNQRQKLAALPDTYPPFIKDDVATLRRWGIGMCPSNQTYCSFSGWVGRITVPVAAAAGNIVAIAARRADGRKENKWLNNPFPKSQHLYGLNFAWQHIAETGRAIIVEGYGDVIALHGAGYQNTVAGMGSTMSKTQMLLLLRYCDRAVILPDQDTSGIQGANKAADKAKSLGLRIKVLYTTDSYGDPEDLARKQPKLLKEMLR